MVVPTVFGRSEQLEPYTLECGRQLETMTAIDGSAAWTYTYDKDGLRLSRTDGTTTYNYVYLGSQLKRMTVGTTEIYFAYDSDGSPMSMVYNGTTYYYVKNLQGDVVGIVDKTGVQVVAYSYDAWGNPLETTVSESVTNAAAIAANNPLRYRGYVYDTETELYYLQSRYYSPEIGRFINADVYTSTGQGLLGNNMFAYCLNNPSNFADPTGNCCIIFGVRLSDCGMPSCKNSSNYQPYRIAIIYDGRSSWGEKGFDHQASQLNQRLSAFEVDMYPFENMGEFVDCWNSLPSGYDCVYIVAHGTPGELHCNGETLSTQGADYSYSDLNYVTMSTLYLFVCNGATLDAINGSTGQYFANITGATVHAVKDGKLSFSLFGCHPLTRLGGVWTEISPAA